MPLCGLRSRAPKPPEPPCWKSLAQEANRLVASERKRWPGLCACRPCLAAISELLLPTVCPVDAAQMPAVPRENSSAADHSSEPARGIKGRFPKVTPKNCAVQNTGARAIAITKLAPSHGVVGLRSNRRKPRMKAMLTCDEMKFHPRSRRRRVVPVVYLFKFVGPHRTEGFEQFACKLNASRFRMEFR